jgi:hypothetical protein
MKKSGEQSPPAASPPRSWRTLRGSKGVIERCWQWVQLPTLVGVATASERVPSPSAGDVRDAVAGRARGPAMVSTSAARRARGRRSGREARRAR